MGRSLTVGAVGACALILVGCGGSGTDAPAASPGATIYRDFH